MLKNRIKKLEERTHPGEPMPKRRPGETDMKYLNRVVGNFSGKGRPPKEWDHEKNGDPKKFVLEQMAGWRER